MSSEKVTQMLEIDSVSDVIRRSRLRWFGHVERQDDGNWMKARQLLEISGARVRGRGKMTWRECVAEDMGVFELDKRNVHDRLKWRTGIFGKLTRESIYTTEVK